MSTDGLTLVVAVNDRRVLKGNLLRSPGLADGERVELLVREGFRSAGAAYNSGLDEATHDLVAFVHQDVYLPDGWVDGLHRCVRELEAAGRPWGVLGSFGVRDDVPRGLGHVYSTGWGLQGTPVATPQPVDTLDEIVLVTRRSSGLRFDAALPHFHMYGVDLCLQARAHGLACFVMPGFCIHNTHQLLTLPREFETAYRYVKHKWRRQLPIRTSCTVIDRFDIDLRRRKLEQLVNRALRRTRTPVPRMDDPTTVLATGALGSQR